MDTRDLIISTRISEQSDDSQVIIWTRLAAFLSRKAKSTQHTYIGVLKEWSEFLGAELGTEKSGELLQHASDIDAARYLSWLQEQQGQRSRHSEEVADPYQISIFSAQHNESRNDGSSDKLSNRTIAKKASILRRIYTMLIGTGLFSGLNPFDKDLVPPPPPESGQKRPTVMVEFEKVMKLIEEPDPSLPKGLRDRAILALLFGAGLRRNEVVRLRLGDILRSEQGTLYLRLRGTKGKHDASQPLPEWAEQHLLNWLAWRSAASEIKGNWLFTGFTGKGGTVPVSRPLTANGVYRFFKRYAQQSEVDRYATPHSARATAITKLLDAGLTHREVLEFSRHQSISMVEVYDKRRRHIEENPARTLSFDDPRLHTRRG
jgi:integrase/recombinase XerD